MIRLSFFAATIAAVAESCKLPENLFAQTERSRLPTCMTTAERARIPVKNFYEILDGKTRIDDSDFTHSAQALYWSNLGEEGGAIAQLEKSHESSWIRASDAFPSAPLFGKEGVKVADLDNIFNNNSWLVSAISTVAETPGRIEKLFLNLKNEQPSAGVYGF